MSGNENYSYIQDKFTIDSVQEKEEEVALEFQQRYEDDDGKLDNPSALVPTIAILILSLHTTGRTSLPTSNFYSFPSTIKHFGGRKD